MAYFKEKIPRCYYLIAIGINLCFSFVLNNSTYNYNNKQASEFGTVQIPVLVIEKRYWQIASKAFKYIELLLIDIRLMFLVLEFVSYIFMYEWKNILQYYSSFFPEFEKFDATKRSK